MPGDVLTSSLIRAGRRLGVEVLAGPPWDPAFLDFRTDDLGPAAQQEMAWLDVDSRVAGSRLIRQAMFVPMLALSCLHADDRAPRFEPAAVRMRPRLTDSTFAAFAVGPMELRCLPGDPLAGEGRVSEDRLGLLREIGADAGATLTPAVAAVQRATGFSPRAQWGLLAWLVGDLWLELTADEPSPTRRGEVDALLGGHPELHRSAPSIREAKVLGEPALRTVGRSCCLAYRWPSSDGHKCAGCLLVPDGERPALWDEEATEELEDKAAALREAG